MNSRIFETQRLKLTQWSPEDYYELFATNDSLNIREILGLETEAEFEKERTKVLGGMRSYNRSLLFFQLLDKESGKTIGGAGFHNWYTDHRRAEIGYALKRDEYKNKGFMKEALQFIIPFGFKAMELHRIEAMVGTENIPSLRLMERFKFKKEGHLREHYYTNDKFEDSIVFSLLKHEFHADS